MSREAAAAGELCMQSVVMGPTTAAEELWDTGAMVMSP